MDSFVCPNKISYGMFSLKLTPLIQMPVNTDKWYFLNLCVAAHPPSIFPLSGGGCGYTQANTFCVLSHKVSIILSRPYMYMDRHRVHAHCLFSTFFTCLTLLLLPVSKVFCLLLDKFYYLVFLLYMYSLFLPIFLHTCFSLYMNKTCVHDLFRESPLNPHPQPNNKDTMACSLPFIYS